MQKIDTGSGPLIGGPARGVDIGDLSFVFDEDSIVVKGRYDFTLNADHRSIARELTYLFGRMANELTLREEGDSDHAYEFDSKEGVFSGYLRLTGGQRDAATAGLIRDALSKAGHAGLGIPKPREKSGNKSFGRAFD